MVVFEDTVAHSLPAWAILAGFYVVRVIRDFSYKNHARLFIQRLIGNSVSASVVTVCFRFRNGFLGKSASGFMPEPDG